MNFLNINTDIIAVNLLPVDKRRNNIFAFVRSLLEPFNQNVQDFWTYVTGGAYIPYSSFGEYNTGDIVTYLGKNYKSIVDSNIGNPVTDDTKWVLTNESAIALSERARYTPNKLPFEYAINKYFGTIFRQPPLQSDIYTETIDAINDSFITFRNGVNSSVVYRDKANGFCFNELFLALPVQFNIYVPNGVYASFDAPETTIRNFADTLVVAGKKYNIITY